MTENKKGVPSAGGYQEGDAYCSWENGQTAACVEVKPRWKRLGFWLKIATVAAFVAVFVLLAIFRP